MSDDANQEEEDGFEALLQQVARATHRTPADPSDDPETPPTPERGTVLEDTYEIIDELSDAGGMGKVFVARDLRLGRRVVVKMVRMRKFDEEHRILFEREARATAQLNHRHIVTIHAFGVWRDVPYMVLEYLRGESLAERLDREGIDAERLVELMVEVVDGLGQAHQRGVFHRDIKPDNIFVTETGEGKLLDFGISMFDRDEEALKAAFESGGDELLDTAPEMSGTPGFMAPEQWRGQEQDARTDVWGIGATLYVGLAGRFPYTPDRPVTLLTDGVDPLAEHAPEVPSGMAEVVDRALQVDPEGRYADADALFEALEELGGSSGGEEAPMGTPFRYLEPFGEGETEWFFGREGETARLCTRVEAHPLTVVAGPSGAGKSSLVRAGLIPALRRRGTVDVMVMRPEGRPLRALQRKLGPLVEEAAELFEQPDFEPLLNRPGLAGEVMRARARSTGGMVLLVVDQFEEIFTRRVSDERREAFVRAMLLASDDPESRVRVVCTMREDFLSRLVAFPELRARATRQLTLLGPPDRVGLREVLVGPAERAGYTWPAETVEQIIAEVAEDPTPLPTLQIVASRLWEMRDRQAERLPAEALEQIGGVSGAVSLHADEIIDGLGDGEAIRMARDILTTLVTGEETGRTLPREELIGRFWSADRAEEVLEHLVAGRLVTISASAGTTSVELAHDSLIERWERLGRWLSENVEARRFRQRLAEAAQHWHREGRPAGLLWQGEMLERGLDWEADQSRALPVTEREFLDRSGEADRRRRRLRRYGLAGLAVVFAVAGIGLAWSVIADPDSRARERASRLAAISGQLRDAEPDLAVTAAGLSVTEVESYEGVTVLHGSLLRDHLVGRHAVDTGVRDAVFTASGTSVLVVPNKGWSLSDWDVASDAVTPIGIDDGLEPTLRLAGEGTLYHQPDRRGRGIWCGEGARVGRGVFGEVSLASGACQFPVIDAEGRAGWVGGSTDGQDVRRLTDVDWHEVVRVAGSADGDFALVAGRRDREGAAGAVEVVALDGTTVVAGFETEEELVDARFAGDEGWVWTVTTVGEGSSGLRVALRRSDGAILDEVTVEGAGSETEFAAARSGRMVGLTGAAGSRLFERVDGGIEERGTHPDGEAVVFSPMGGRMAVRGGRRVHLYERSAEGDRASVLTHDAGVDGVRFVDGTDRLVTWAGRRGFLWNAEGGRIDSFVATGKIRGLVAAEEGSRVLVATERGVEVHRLWGLAEGVAIRHRRPVVSVDVDERGERVASVSEEGEVRIRGLDGEELVVRQLGQEVGHVALESEGERWLAAGGRRLVVGGAEGAIAREWRTPGRVERAGWSPDEDEVWVVTDEPSVVIYPVEGGEAETMPADEPVRAVRWAEEGRLLVVGEGRAVVSDGDGGERRAFDWGGRFVDAHVGGEAVRVAGVDSEGRLRVYGPEDGGRVGVGVDGVTVDAAFLPEGDRVATLDDDGRIAVWRVDGGRIESIGRAGSAGRLAISPGGRFLLAAGREHVWVWHLEEARRLGRLPTGTTDLSDRHFSGNGTFVSLLADNDVSVYALPVDELIRIGRRQARRPFTAADFRRFDLPVPASYR